MGESVNKVICETEFRDSCVKKLENICNNVSTGELECELVDRFNCVDSMTNKCGLESVLKNVSYAETVCETVMEDICELEVRNGIKEPVEGSCLSKPVEKCGPVTRFTEEFVEEEVCRDIPIKDCENVQEEVCNEKKEEVCEDLETTTESTTTTSSTTSPSTTESTTVNEFGSVSTEEASRMDVSKIIFSDEAINSRNKELSNRVYVGRIPTTTVRIPDRRRNQNTNSQIFFPDK